MRRAATILLGATFLFSGFVKMVDPWGVALKLSEYFSVYGLGFLDFTRFPLALVFCAVELTLGFVLVCGFLKKIAAWAALIVMGFFLLLTLLSATFFPVADCGCFGDALPLTPWESVGKNIMLTSFAIITWLDRGSRDRGWLWASLFFVLSLGLGIFCLRHLPVIDFLPFKKGVDLRADTDNILLRQFVVFGPEGDVTARILSTPGRLNLLCAADLAKIGKRCEANFKKIVEQAHHRGEKTVIITSVPSTETWFGAPVFSVDASTLVTLLRARFGLVVVDDGVIVDKKTCIDI